MSELSDQLRRINERITEMEKRPSELTRDALLGDIIALYDSVKKADFQPVDEPQVEKEEPEPVVESIPEPIAESVPEPIEVPVMEKPAEPVEEVKPQPQPEVVEEPVAEAPTVVEQPTPPAPKKAPLIGKDEPTTKGADKKILAGQLNQSPLQDLRSGIPLNEKFGIIRNLFKGNASDFGDAVLKLNNAASADEMQHYLQLLAQRFGWDVESEAYLNFSGYVERKMMTLQPSNANSNK